MDNEKEKQPTQSSVMDLTSLLKNVNEEETKKSELEKMKEKKELGYEVNKSEYTDGTEQKVIKPISQKTDDDVVEHSNSHMSETDELIEATKKIYSIRQPQNGLENAERVDALSRFKQTGVLDEIGKKWFNYIENVKNDPVAQARMEASQKEELHTETVEYRSDDDIITLLIDKTGMGANIVLTDSEKDKMKLAKQINIVEVEDEELRTAVMTPADKSFVDMISEYEVSTTSANVIFPASRFSATMTGLSFGELSDVGLSSENITVSKVNKKLSIIYNKMKNISCGNFKDYNDFLKHFACVDIDIAIYGLIVATFPELDNVQLRCTNDRCNKVYDHEYVPRQLINLEKAPKTALHAMDKVIACGNNVDKLKDIVQNSPVFTKKRIKLPVSGYILELGIASAYDYLHGIVSAYEDDNFKKSHPDDVNDVLYNSVILTSVIRTVFVPINGKYVEYTNIEDIVQALATLPPDEYALVATIFEKFYNSYKIKFELNDVRCPHCGITSDSIEINLETLVFLKYQTLGNTTIDLQNLLDL